MTVVRPSAPATRDALRVAAAAAAVGGATGASLRWATSALIGADDAAAWPWATLIVNVVGCVAIGVASRRLVHGSAAWDFVATGVLGGFTTMSAFAVELNELVDAQRGGVAVAYAAATLLGGVGGVALAGGRRPDPDLRSSAGASGTEAS